jgi:hypothetical protein
MTNLDDLDRSEFPNEEERPPMKNRPLIYLALGFATLGGSGRAEAGLLLSFDQSSYKVGDPGSTVQVRVFVSQIAGGPQVGPGNELLTAGVKVSFNNPQGVAAVLSNSDVTKGPAWDVSSASVTTTTTSLAETSLLGISNLTSPLLLGTFTFTSLTAKGTTTISVSRLDPTTPSFVTSQGDRIDPTNTATATITAVPEPATLGMILTGAPLLLGVWALRRRRHSRTPSAP